MSRLSCVHFFPDRVFLDAQRHLVRSFRSGHIDFRSGTSTWVIIALLKRSSALWLPEDQDLRKLKRHIPTFKTILVKGDCISMQHKYLQLSLALLKFPFSKCPIKLKNKLFRERMSKVLRECLRPQVPVDWLWTGTIRWEPEVEGVLPSPLQIDSLLSMLHQQPITDVEEEPEGVDDSAPKYDKKLKNQQRPLLLYNGIKSFGQKAFWAIDKRKPL